MGGIVIVGAGRVGTACAALIEAHLNDDVAIIDSNQEALNTISKLVPIVRTHHASTSEDLIKKLKYLSPYAVICCTPFEINIQIATVCAELGCHYMDFTEDVSVRDHIAKLKPTKPCTFVLQTGLAPGLVTQIGLGLCSDLQRNEGAIPHTLDMRVGALPSSTLNCNGSYALTWSTSGLINEYLKSAEMIVDGKLVTVPSLEMYEELLADDGRIRFEAFNTSGGMGSAEMYSTLSNVSYKTLRYPGHLGFVLDKIIRVLDGVTSDQKLNVGIDLAEKYFNFTRDDVVHMVIHAVGNNGKRQHMRTFYRAFYPYETNSFILTALEATTAGTGVALLWLLEQGRLKSGVVYGGSVPYELLEETPLGPYLLGT